MSTKAPKKPRGTPAERRGLAIATVTPRQWVWLVEADGEMALTGRPIYAATTGEARVARTCEAKGWGRHDELTGYFTINDAGRARVWRA